MKILIIGNGGREHALTWAISQNPRCTKIYCSPGNAGTAELATNIDIDITSKELKNKLIEVNTTLKFQDKDANEKKSYYEIVYATIIRVDDDVKEKRDLEKIILCDVPTKIYPKLETSFLNLVHNSGHPDIKLEKKIDFEKLFKERFN